MGAQPISLGVGGGVGLAAIGIGRILGLQVIAAASSSYKRALAVQFGAESVLDTSSEDLKVRALAHDGRNLVVGFAAGDIPRLPLNLVLLGNRRIIRVNRGGWLRSHLVENAALSADMVAAVERGDLHSVAPTEYAFTDAARALDDQVHRRAAGKSALIL